MSLETSNFFVAYKKSLILFLLFPHRHHNFFFPDYPSLIFIMLNNVVYMDPLQVVREAIASGVEGYDAETRQAVAKAAHGLRLTRDTAMSIASKAVSIIVVFL